MRFGTNFEPVSSPLYDGVRHCFEFPNGFGASVVRHDHSYGHEEGLWELAVLDKSGALCYDTEITSNVEGHLSIEDVGALLVRIAALPAR